MIYTDKEVCKYVQKNRKPTSYTIVTQTKKTLVSNCSISVFFYVAIEWERVAQSLDYRNAQYFDEETVKLDRWSDDLKFGLETEIKQIDKDIKETKKQAAASSTLAEKLGEQKKLRALEGVRNAKRRSLYEAQDKIDADRDVLIKKVEKQLKCSTKNERLFVVRWTLN